jgi:ribosomal-protein-alanine N-acetyltransferase
MAALYAAAFPDQRPWRAEEFAALLDRADTRVLTVRDAEGRPAGLCLLQLMPPEAEILTLLVAPARQGAGYGTRLLASTLDAAADAGATRLFLEVGAGNAAARALYAGAGFRQTGQRPGYYRHRDGRREDAVLLSRDLPARKSGKGGVACP